MEGKIIVNKHYDASSAISINSFSDRVVNGNEYRKGEIIVCNEPDKETLFIVNALGEVVNPFTVPWSVISEYVKKEAEKFTHREYCTKKQYEAYKADWKSEYDGWDFYIYEEDDEPITGKTGTTATVSGDTLILTNVYIDGTTGELILATGQVKEETLILGVMVDPEPQGGLPIVVGEEMTFMDGTANVYDELLIVKPNIIEIS